VAPVVAPVAATAPAVVDKQDKVADKQDKVADKKDKQAATVPPPDLSLAVKSAAVPPSAPAQPSVSLMASKSMMAPPDPAAGKLIEPAAPPKTVTSAPLPEVVAVAPKASKEAEPVYPQQAPNLWLNTPNLAWMSAAPIRSPACARFGTDFSSRNPMRR
jgi:hypothetical protein